MRGIGIAVKRGRVPRTWTNDPRRPGGIARAARTAARKLLPLVVVFVFISGFLLGSHTDQQPTPSAPEDEEASFKPCGAEVCALAYKTGGGSVWFRESNDMNYLEFVSWGVDRVGAFDIPYKGSGVKVAVLDSGINQTHVDLAGQVAAGANFIGTGSGVKANWTWPSWNDDNGHGTHVASVLAAAVNGMGVVGIAPWARLYAIKVLNATGSGVRSDIAKAIDWATSTRTDADPTNNIDIVSMSLYTTTNDTTLYQSIQRAYAAGIIMVAGAGNNARTTNAVNYPAAYPQVIAVGATGYNNHVADFSTRGSYVDFAAPGVRIMGVCSYTMSALTGTSWCEISGTSMSTAEVSGLIADYISRDGRMNYTKAYATLKANALDIESAGFDNASGWGLARFGGVAA